MPSLNLFLIGTSGYEADDTQNQTQIECGPSKPNGFDHIGCDIHETTRAFD
jgi:hypothetical protein